VVKRFWWVAAIAALAAFGLGATQGSAQVSPARVATFPIAGSQAIRPEAQVSFRGAPAGALGPITVTGERSGAHAGALRPHSDGDGASFVPETPFLAGEKVIVRTQLDLAGGRDGAVSFTVARRPSPSADIDGRLRLPPLPPAAIDHFRSRPDLEAPVVRITRRAGRTAPGYIFLAPFSPKGSPRPDGPLITDDNGDLVWFKPVRRGTAVTDLKVQQLGGQPVITWWEGRFAIGWGYGAYRVFDSSYRQVASITPANGYRADLHDMQLTDRGTALLLAYDRVKRDLRRIGGPRRGIVLDNVVQEIDLATGLVVFEWHSLGPVPFEESRVRPDGRHSWDYFHVNSVEADTDGDLIVSARNTCTLYKLDRDDGSIVWRLGGAKSDFRMGKGTRFCFQHDARRSRPGELTLFDNSAGPPVLRKQSRGLRLRVDEQRKRVSLVRQYEHPGILAPNQGSTRVQPNGNVFVGWGAAPVFSEFSPSGRLLLDGRLTRGKGNYRAIRAGWTGRPATRPAIAARRGKGGRLLVHASWNGATEVARWQVVAGSRGLASKARDGFETVIAVRAGSSQIAVRALDASGRVLGTSRTVRR
jgi:hypothetical protein